jgi:iron complex transport system permease protein
MKHDIKKKAMIIALLAGPLVIVFWSLFLGRYPLSLTMVLKTLWFKLSGYTAGGLPDIYETVVWQIRLPRAILGAMVGASLAVSGAAFQGLFHNPLVSSGILGVTSGAGFGAALAILLFHHTFAIYVMAFTFGLAAVGLSYLIGRVYNTNPTIMLVLGGVIVSSIFSALISFAKYVADPYDQLPAIVFWLMGSLASARYEDIAVAGLPMLLGIGGLYAVRWKINVLSMGDREARALGLDHNFIKGLLIFCAALATAGAVCVSGNIGWVGLVIPHIGRMLVGNDNRILIPTSISLGACFLVVVDNVGRIISGGEIPLGILTALIGGPCFAFLLKKTKGGGWN